MTPVSVDNQAIERYNLRKLPAAVLILAFSALVVLILRRAWLSDDAFITFRSIDNFLHGYGLTWNVNERVQAFTHPLWMLLLSLASYLTGELLLTTLILSIIISLTAVGLLVFGVARSVWSGLFCVVVLALSGAFVDYATSGLENPLSYLLLAAFFVVYFRQKPSLGKLFFLSFIASLAAVNRLDTLLFFVPALVFELVQYRQLKGLLAVVLGVFPLLLWESFSLVYYGFLFPNTAYAKLNTGIPALELAGQGLSYLAESLSSDPLTLVVTLAGCVLGFLSLGERRNGPLSLGILLYLAYVVSIGGDFMSGRFLALPLFAALGIIARFDLAGLGWKRQVLLYGVILILGLSGSYPTLGAAYPEVAFADTIDETRRGIANERLAYGRSNSLFGLMLNNGVSQHERAQAGLAARLAQEKAITARTIGMLGYYAGPKVYIIDQLALADPLLARLPPTYTVNWRIGHFRRTMPEGYYQSRVYRRNAIRDDNLEQYYAALTRIVSGPLLSLERFKTIWQMNTGQLDHLIDPRLSLYPDLVHVTLEQAPVTRPPMEGENPTGALAFTDSGLEIELDEASRAEEIELSLDADAGFRLLFYLGEQEVGQLSAPALPNPAAGLAVRSLAIPPAVRKLGFDRLHILPVVGDGSYSLGHLRLLPLTAGNNPGALTSVRLGLHYNEGMN